MSKQMSSDNSMKELASLADTQVEYFYQINQATEQITKLYAQIAEINRKIHPIVVQNMDIDKKIKDIRHRLQNQPQDPMIGWMDLSKIKEQNLESLTTPIINHIIKYRYGTDLLDEFGHPTEWMYSSNLTETQYRIKLIRIIRERSCKYCHLVTHVIKECPDLQQRKCGTCHQPGHNTRFCPDG
jgi:regulator of replication initiation timing